jgi:hypothetical protein
MKTESTQGSNDNPLVTSTINFTSEKIKDKPDTSNWPNSTELSAAAHEYTKRMEETYHNKISQGLFSCIYGAYIDGFLAGLLYNKK